jgi:hypothetical protein
MLPREHAARTQFCCWAFLPPHGAGRSHAGVMRGVPRGPTGDTVLAAAISRFASSWTGSRGFLVAGEFEVIVERDVAEGQQT